MFVRLKKLKGFHYAYLVKNTWTKKGPRHKTKKYLGRCYDVTGHKKDMSSDGFFEDIERFVHGNSLRNVICKMVEFELLRHGFVFDNKNKRNESEELGVGGKKLKIFNIETGNEVVLKINEGYMCKYLLERILKFTFKGEDDYERQKEMVKFAESFVLAGLDVPKEIFVEIYRKVTNE